MHLKKEEEIGFKINSTWYFRKLERLITMLAHGKTTDFIDGADTDVAIFDIVSSVTPYTVIQKMKDQLKQAQEEGKKAQELKAELMNLIVGKSEAIEIQIAELKQAIRNNYEAGQWNTELLLQGFAEFKRESNMQEKEVLEKWDTLIEQIEKKDKKNAFSCMIELIGLIGSLVTIGSTVNAPAVLNFLKAIYNALGKG